MKKIWDNMTTISLVLWVFVGGCTVGKESVPTVLFFLAWLCIIVILLFIEFAKRTGRDDWFK